jgi:hypothetical protein
MADRITLWVLRLLWFSLPYTAGALFVDALGGRSSGFGSTAAAGLWAGWAIGLVAMLVPHAMSLTLLRIIAPASVAAALWATAAGSERATELLALVVTGCISVIVLSAPIGATFINGAAYGDERRLPLRPPGRLLLGPIPLAWVVAVVGTATGPLLLGSRRWVAGTVAVAVGMPLAFVAVRALHGLGRRWLVFVPAGMVVHDLSALADPQLFRRADIDRLGPALADTDAEDLTLMAPGLALELAFVSPMKVVRRPARGQPLDDGRRVRALLVTPSRPGDVLREAETRRIRVG